MQSVWFCVPAHGRERLTRACLRQLRRTCDALEAEGVHAQAAVVAEDANLDTARELDFATVRRANQPLGRKWNDAYQLAADPRFNKHPADFVVALGSDDWVHPDLILAHLETDGELRCSRRSSVVREDGRRIAPLHIMYQVKGYDFGDGVRMIRSDFLRKVGYRPAEEDRNRAIDTSVWRQLGYAHGRPPRITYTDLHPFQIVDFKSSGEQLNSYARCLDHLKGWEQDPWRVLARYYPAEALDDMRAVYRLPVRVAA